MKRIRTVTLLFAVLTFCSLTAQAATLFGKVIEVTDGDVIRIMNMNRPVRVRLIGLDAPEQNQLFGDVAKQHLSDLILDRNVVVEYSGLGRDGTVVGRVLLNNVDMNAQMIRDGAAWFDPSYKAELREEQREIYSQCELAARNEKRGLWQSENAIAPWEFVKNEQMKRDALATLARSTEVSRRPRTELTSESLINRNATASAKPSSADMGWLSSSENKTWERLQPSGENFSAMIPSGGKLSREPIPVGSKTVDMNYYVAREGTSIYALVWTTGPSIGESDNTVIKSALSGFLRGIGAGYESLGGKFSCEPTSETDVSAKGFTGRSFNLTGCTIPAEARIFTRSGGGKRQLYIGAVFYAHEDTNAQKFMQSFQVNANPPATRSSKTSAAEQNH